MKIIICLAALVSVSYASHLAVPAAIPTGTSTQFRSQDNIGNFNFGYNEDHATGGTFRREQGDAYGARVGSYGLRDADGRTRIVNYVADAGGFRANIQTNEPGVEPKDSAAAFVNKAVAVAAPVALAAPAPVAYGPAPVPVAAAPAPIAYGPAPVAYGPAPVAYGPAPVPVAAGPAPIAYGPAPIAYGPAPVAYGPAPVAYGPGPVLAAPAAIIPRAFSYSVVANHLAAPALPVPIAGPAYGPVRAY